MARRIPRDESLARVHGPGALFSAAYGNVGSSIYYALGVTAAFALGLTPVAFLVAGLIFVATAATYSEATVMFPEAGGSSSFARHAFNETASFVAGWGQLLNYTITVAISAFFVPHYLAVFWEPLGRSPGDIIAGALLIVALAALNVKGTEESTRLNLVLAIGDLLTQILLVLIGFFLVFSPDVLVSNVQFGVAPTWSDFVLGIAVGMIAYTGIETISNMAEETKDAARNIPKGSGYTVLAVVGLYALLPVIALSAMPVTKQGGEYVTELGTKYADDPVLGIVDNLGASAALTDGLRIYVGILAAVILIIATNAALIGVSRLTFSMGHYRQLPERLRRVHPRFRTPYVSILIFSGAAIITLIPGQAELLATLYSFGAMLSFTIAHASLIRLRQKYPNRAREWKPRFVDVKIKGVEVPMTAVLGGLGTFAAWLVVIALNPRTLVIGLSWMAVGFAIFVFYRRSQGLSLTQTEEMQMPESLGVEDVEYESVMLVLEDKPGFPRKTVETAISLASRRRRGIHVLAFVTVPKHLPIDDTLDDTLAAEIEAAQSKVEQAKLIGGSKVSGQVQPIRPDEAGQTAIREAVKVKATALVVELRYRGGRPLIGPDLQKILAQRPCRVVIVGDPEAERDAPAATLRHDLEVV